LYETVDIHDTIYQIFSIYSEVSNNI